jgi:spermidine synthase
VTPRAAYALLSALLPVALWHHVVYRRGAAYLLLDQAASSRAAALVHAASLAAGAALAVRAVGLTPWRGPRLLCATGLLCAAAQVGAFFAFGSARGFPVYSLIVASSLGVAFGALAGTQARALSALAFPRGEVLDALKVDTLAPALALAVVYLLAVERLGPLRTGLLLSLGVCILGHLGASLLAPGAPPARATRKASAASSYALAVLVAAVEPLTPFAETLRVPDPVVFAHNTTVGRIVLTSGRGAFQLFVDGLMRQSTIDNRRRAEAAAHPAMLAAPRRRSVLLLGGGDGATLREVLKYPDRGQITVVEPEAGLSLVAAAHPVLRKEGGDALSAPGVAVLRDDPMRWLGEHPERFDVVIVDLLDPEGPRRAKLYTRHFYRLVGEHLADDGVGALVASASPLSQRKAFWCVVETLEAAGLRSLPYRASLPSLGDWGYALFAHAPLAPPTAAARAALPQGLAYLDSETLAALFLLAPDEQRLPVEVNLMYRQVLLKYRAEAAR